MSKARTKRPAKQPLELPQTEIWPDDEVVTGGKARRQSVAALLAEAALVTEAAWQLFPPIDTTNKRDIRNALGRLVPKLQKAADKANRRKRKDP